ncbi:hypothetical protein KB206_00320 [Microvirga sp. STS02]|uniref:hypothetical protein n=1 Tax=Hymenobacter negativus TaxID=2795026 RepID=UPI0018DEB3EE|nr:MULTISPECIES: hypothetical protein [Bacteria]MBH8567309.1 hypothetical protein [Hymenobacter negativus]MBR7207041.1 hypothetical protein [Microvirga sp. STS02]
MSPATPQSYALQQALNEFILALVKPLTDKVEQLEKKLNLIESLQDEWVDTKTALKMIGRKRPETMKSLRERDGTLIKYKQEGSRFFYCRRSIIAHSESKTVGRTTARDLSHLIPK